MKAPRLGRGTRLDRKKRVQVWHVFDEYLNILRDRAIRDVDTAYYECRKIAEKNLPNAIFPHIVIDEGQDLSPNAYRLLRVLAGPEHQNDLFIVGDTHQRMLLQRISSYVETVSMQRHWQNILRKTLSYLRLQTIQYILAMKYLKGISYLKVLTKTALLHSTGMNQMLILQKKRKAPLKEK